MPDVNMPGWATGSYVDPATSPFNGNGGNAAYATAAQLAALGYTGANPAFNIFGGASDMPNNAAGLQQFQQYLQDNGYQLGTTYTGDADNNYIDQYYKNGQAVGPTETHENQNDDQFAGAIALASLVAGGAAAGAFGASGSGAAAADAGGAAAGGAAGGAADGTVGAGLATSAPAYGGVGTAGAGAGTDAIVGGSSQLGNAGFIGSLQAGDYGGALSAAGTNVGNYLSTPSGLQSAAGLLGAIGGAAGAGSGLNSATNTTQNTVDPRVAQYVYGANGNGGLLGNVNSLMNSQLATGGLNATQTQGLNMQLAALNDPAYGASLQQMRNSGSGLLGQSVAGNPFTSGQASLSAPANSQIQAGQAQVPGFTPMQTQLNNPQRPGPNMTGLLGNLRPTGS